MKKIQIMGTGCAKCQRLTDQTKIAVRALTLDADVEKVTDMKAILAAGVMTTPALVVDGKVKSTGRVPSIEEIKSLLIS
ncbi:MAG: thioredoxin family protein [Elusimicrobiota bacterium]|jgi:small redox-active disulfide protein 2